MVGRRHLWILLAVAALVLGSAAAAEEKPTPDKKSEAKEEKPIRWVFVNYRRFQVEHLIGNLSSCAYRATKPGETLVMEWKDKTQVTAIRKGEEVDIQVRVNDAWLPKFSEEMMVKGIEDAITDCFTKMTEEEPDQETPAWADDQGASTTASPKP